MIKGNDGDFTVKVKLGPRLINNQCTACGLCAEVCPREQPRETGSSQAQKAAYIKKGLAFPAKYTIDPQSCLRESCGLCLKVCEYEAIQLGAQESEIELNAQKVIVTSGWEAYDASLIENFCYADEPDVVSNMEFEIILASCTEEGKKLQRPSDGKSS